VAVTDYSDANISLAKGDEMGRFNMGSTVILLMPPGTVEGLPELDAGAAVKVGQKLAVLTA
jgi:phosphatidylserine decarboxylase